MNETKWKQVSAAECLKWQIDNPMKEAKGGTHTTRGNLRFNPESGGFEYFFNWEEWGPLSYPGYHEYTYFIPEVTE